MIAQLKKTATLAKLNLRDALLHVPLGLAFTGIAYLTLLLPAPLDIFAIGAEMIVLREVSQIQEDIDSPDWKILTGWDFWNWKAGKNIETWVPVVVLVAIAAALTM